MIKLSYKARNIIETVILSAAVAVAAVFITLSIFKPQLPADAKLTYDVCNYSRQITSGSIEEACGQLQDQFKYEFICDSKEMNAKCHVEKNDKLGADEKSQETLPVKSGDGFTANNVMASVNAERAKANKKPLSVNQKLVTSACLKLDNMVSENYWAHDSPEGVEPWHYFELAQYRYQFAGENLAYGQTTVQQLTEQWMNSQKHRETLLSDNFDQTGVCTRTVHFQGRDTTLTVQHFGKMMESTNQ